MKAAVTIELTLDEMHAVREALSCHLEDQSYQGFHGSDEERTQLAMVLEVVEKLGGCVRETVRAYYVPKEA